jgi:hypothetical protein
MADSSPIHYLGIIRRSLIAITMAAFFIVLAIFVPLWPITAPLFLMLAIGSLFHGVFGSTGTTTCPVCAEKLMISKRKGGVVCRGCKAPLVIRGKLLWRI